MPDSRSHRGPHPEDARLFGADQVPRLRRATSELSWLLSRSYAAPSSLKLVGDRYQLDARQRTAVGRCACSEALRQRRLDHRRLPQFVAGKELWIDGYNVLTTIEAALSGGVVIRGRDGCLRDMASMHGSYRKVAETIPAIELLGDLLAGWDVAACRWLLDQSVSNSGRLRAILLEAASQRRWNWTVDLVPDPDSLLANASVCVATADSEILNSAGNWVSLAELAITERIHDAWIVDLSVES